MCVRRWEKDLISNNAVLIQSRQKGLCKFHVSNGFKWISPSKMYVQIEMFTHCYSVRAISTLQSIQFEDCSRNREKEWKNPKQQQPSSSGFVYNVCSSKHFRTEYSEFRVLFIWIAFSCVNMTAAQSTCLYTRGMEVVVNNGKILNALSRHLIVIFMQRKNVCFLFIFHRTEFVAKMLLIVGHNKYTNRHTKRFSNLFLFHRIWKFIGNSEYNEYAIFVHKWFLLLLSVWCEQGLIMAFCVHA